MKFDGIRATRKVSAYIHSLGYRRSKGTHRDLILLLSNSILRYSTGPSDMPHHSYIMRCVWLSVIFCWHLGCRQSSMTFWYNICINQCILTNGKNNGYQQLFETVDLLVTARDGSCLKANSRDFHREEKQLHLIRKQWMLSISTGHVSQAASQVWLILIEPSIMSVTDEREKLIDAWFSRSTAACLICTRYSHSQRLVNPVGNGK